MRLGRRSLVVLGLGPLLLAAGIGITHSAGAAAPKQVLAVVASNNSPIRNLSFYDLKRAYLGESTAVGSKRLLPLNFPAGSRERTLFDRAVLGMSQEEVARYWIDRKIRGQPGSPRAITPVEVLLKIVTKLDGAITYVDARDIKPGVQVVTIDGKLPDDPGYPVAF
jgi:hypothetical protein